MIPCPSLQSPAALVIEILIHQRDGGPSPAAVSSHPSALLPAERADTELTSPISWEAVEFPLYLSYTTVTTYMELLTVLVWEDRKSRTNLKKHGVSFESARLVFDDPLHLSRQDRVVDGELR